MLKQMYPACAGRPGLKTDNWEWALRRGVDKAIKACQSLGIDPKRLIVFPWIKRKALARLSGIKEENPHYGKLIETAILPKLAEEYKRRTLDSENYLAGKMSEESHLQMEEGVKNWLTEREDEVSGDICFSVAVLDLFKGYSADATRFETNKEARLVPATSFLTMQMLLMQSQLLVKDKQQGFDMPGDKYDREGMSRFPSAPSCYVRDNGFGFVIAHTGNAYSGYGSVVFLAQK